MCVQKCRLAEYKEKFYSNTGTIETAMIAEILALDHIWLNFVGIYTGTGIVKLILSFLCEPLCFVCALGVMLHEGHNYMVSPGSSIPRVKLFKILVLCLLSNFHTSLFHLVYVLDA